MKPSIWFQGLSFADSLSYWTKYRVSQGKAYWLPVDLRASEVVYKNDLRFLPFYLATCRDTVVQRDGNQRITGVMFDNKLCKREAVQMAAAMQARYGRNTIVGKDAAIILRNYATHEYNGKLYCDTHVSSSRIPLMSEYPIKSGLILTVFRRFEEALRPGSTGQLMNTVRLINEDLIEALIYLDGAVEEEEANAIKAIIAQSGASMSDDNSNALPPVFVKLLGNLDVLGCASMDMSRLADHIRDIEKVSRLIGIMTHLSYGLPMEVRGEPPKAAPGFGTVEVKDISTVGPREFVLASKQKPTSLAVKKFLEISSREVYVVREEVTRFTHQNAGRRKDGSSKAKPKTYAIPAVQAMYYQSARHNVTHEGPVAEESRVQEDRFKRAKVEDGY